METLRPYQNVCRYGSKYMSWKTLCVRRKQDSLPWAKTSLDPVYPDTLGLPASMSNFLSRPVLLFQQGFVIVPESWSTEGLFRYWHPNHHGDVVWQSFGLKWMRQTLTLVHRLSVLGMGPWNKKERNKSTKTYIQAFYNKRKDNSSIK